MQKVGPILKTLISLDGKFYLKLDKNCKNSVLPPLTSISPEAIAITGLFKPDNAILKTNSSPNTSILHG